MKKFSSHFDIFKDKVIMSFVLVGGCVAGAICFWDTNQTLTAAFCTALGVCLKSSVDTIRKDWRGE